MCGRFLFDADFDEIYKKFMIYEHDFKFHKGDYRPTDLIPAIVHEAGFNHLKPMQWGLDGYEKNQVLFNARSETLMEKRRFSQLMDKRCIIPATAFYEWETRGKEKMMHRFGNKGLLAFAAIYESSLKGNQVTIITMPAAGDVAKVHDRMPASIHDEDLNLWLRGSVSEAYERLMQQRPFYELLDEQEQLSFF